ncbi:hypothetical protein SCLARK_001270 [Spiroplasma clarkii]|nr:hypothetical protein [Spiroplasma clarkii]ARU91812.1 hypothetical protein SCLARK_001270 [Spiroplasma clarkii]
MYKILLTGHGKFCEGLIDVFEMLTGEIGVLESLALTKDMEFDVFAKLVANKINQDNWIILADIIGGTPMKVF